MKTALHILQNTTAVVAASVMFAGCTTVNTVERAEPVAQKQMVADKRIITDHTLSRKVRIVGVNDDMSAEHLKIQIEVLNATHSLQNFSYRIEWYDDKGMLISTPTGAYIPQQIQGKESKFITAVAPTPKAKDFRVKFIE
jgi:uncharacterized protein YcfL